MMSCPILMAFIECTVTFALSVKLGVLVSNLVSLVKLLLVVVIASFCELLTMSFLFDMHRTLHTIYWM